MNNGEAILLWALFVFAVVFFNSIVGAFVWSSIDNDRKDLLAWYRESEEISRIIPFFILQLWPIGLAIWLYRKWQ